MGHNTVSMRRLVLLGSALVSTVCAQSCVSVTARYTPQLGTGYTAKPILNGLKSPRDMIFDKLGNMLVVEQGGGGIRYIKLMESGDSVCVESSKTLITDSTLNHGIDITADGKTLIVSSLASVFAYTYDAETGTATDKKIIINNMTNGGHQTRTLLISKLNPDLLLVSRGSDANIDARAGDITSGHSTIKYYSISAILQTPADHAKDGIVLGWGLRNNVGLGEHPITGGIYSVENSMDDIKRQGKDVHNDNPAEELNYHGVVNDTDKNPLQGKNYGYPGCVSAWDPSVLSNPDLKVGSQFVPNLAAGTTIATADADCAKFEAPRLVFPAHTAPLDIKFKADGSAAFVSFHGSWDRQPPDGYRVMRYEFGADGQPKELSTSKTASIPVMLNADNSKCPGACFRPAGLALDTKGRLFMSSDSTGEIFVITGA